MSEVLASRRLLLALSGGRLEAARLPGFAALAARMRVELTALFVEDEGLLRAGRLPVALEIGHVSARVRGLSGRGVESALRSSAERARQVLETSARAASLPFSFEVARGQPLASALAWVERVDALLFPGSAPSMPAAGQRRAPLLVMLAVDEALPRRLAAALDFAAAIEAEPILGLLNGGGTDHLAAKRRIADLLGARASSVRFLHVPGPAVEETLRAARGFRPVTVAVPATLPTASLGVFMHRLRCPLLLLP